MKRPTGVALLLAQLGTHAAERFAARVAELGLTPAQVGVLRIVGQNPGLSQQAVSERLGTAPSRVVKLVDELEEKGLVERVRSADDRRTYELQIAATAADRVVAVRTVVGQHDAELVAPLTPAERKTLVALLQKMADAQGLTQGLTQGQGGAPRR